MTKYINESRMRGIQKADGWYGFVEDEKYCKPGYQPYVPCTGEDTLTLFDLPDEEREFVLHWCASNFREARTCLELPTSYGLKHIIQRVYNIYLSNNQFKHAMYMCGFKEKDPRALNWQYFIKKSSAALNLSQAYHDGIPARYDITKYFKEDK